MIPFHVMSGMNGAVMVLPRDGLKDAKGKPVRYDRAYYVGEQDLYLPKGRGWQVQDLWLARRRHARDARAVQGI